MRVLEGFEEVLDSERFERKLKRMHRMPSKLKRKIWNSFIGKDEEPTFSFFHSGRRWTSRKLAAAEERRNEED